MKTIYLVRHAKAVEHSSVIHDFYRPLSERGVGDAHEMAQKIHKQVSFPQLVITSPATRALTTAIIFSKKLGFPMEEIKLNKELYESTTKHYYKVISSLDENINTLFIFAHNPTITEFVNRIADGENISHIPTSGIAGIQFESWEDVPKNKGRLILFDYPH